MLKKEIVAKLKEDKVLLATIADSRKVSYQTAERWAAENHENLLHIGTLSLIATEYKLPLHSLYIQK